MLQQMYVLGEVAYSKYRIIFPSKLLKTELLWLIKVARLVSVMSTMMSPRSTQWLRTGREKSVMIFWGLIR